MYLRFNHEPFGTSFGSEFFCSSNSFIGSVCNNATLNGNTKFFEKVFGLVFVNVHIVWFWKQATFFKPLIQETNSCCRLGESRNRTKHCKCLKVWMLKSLKVRLSRLWVHQGRAKVHSCISLERWTIRIREILKSTMKMSLLRRQRSSHNSEIRTLDSYFSF